MNNTLTKESSFIRVSGGLSVRKVIKAKDAAKTPEQHFRDHILGAIRAGVKLYPKEAIDIVREEIGVALKI